MTIKEGIRSKDMPRLLNLMMQVRHVCNHPFLIKGAEEKIVTKASGKPVEEVMIECR